MIDAPGQPFYDPEANAELFKTLEQDFVRTGTHLLIKLPHHINDAAFAQVVADEVRRITPAEQSLASGS